MAIIEFYCGNQRCTGFPEFFSVEVLLSMNRCPNCASRLRFKCSACGYIYAQEPGSLRWCAFCGDQFEQAQPA